MSWETKKLKVKTAKRDIPIWKVVYRGQLLPPKGMGLLALIIKDQSQKFCSF